MKNFLIYFLIVVIQLHLLMFFFFILLPYLTLLLCWKVIGGPHDWPIYTKGTSFDVHKEASLKSLILEQSMVIHLSSSPLSKHAIFSFYYPLPKLGYGLVNEKEKGSFEKSNRHLFFLKPFSKEEGVSKSSFGSFNT